MGCVCCSLSSFISIVLHALERITLCTVCAMLVCCILFTIMGVLVMGVGIGFHYCEVEKAAEAMAMAAKSAGEGVESRRTGDAMRSGSDEQQSKVLRSVNTAVKRGFARQLGRRDRADVAMPSNNNTINDLILGRNHSGPLDAIALAPSYNHTMERVERDGHTYPSASLQVGGIVLGPNYTDASLRAKRGLALGRNHTDISSSVYRDLALEQNDTVSSRHNIILGRNHVDNSRRPKRDLGLNPVNDESNDMVTVSNYINDSVLNVSNDTVLNVTDDKVLNFMNDSPTYEFDVDVHRYSTDETPEGTSERVTSNVSIYDAISLRQNCTLLNFFTRFLQF